MKILKKILAVGLLMNVAILCAQQEAYVAAESGLSLRDQPDINAKMLSKLSYGEAIGVLEETDIKLVVLDGGEKVSGEWVKVETRNHIGYVFNGYLSPNKIARTIRLNLDNLNIEIKNLATSDYKR
jgi:CBS domain-containing protein